MASSANRNPEPPGSPVTLITGTSRGIGRHLAKHCLARGHVVVGCSRTPADWSAAGYRHVVADVREEGEVLALFRELRRAHGRLDHLVNNAGIASMNHALTTPVSTVRNILDVNVVSTFLFAREAAKLMMRKGFGRIVNLSSVALLVALIHRGAVVVPLTDSVETQKPQFREVAEVEVVIALEGDGEPDFRETGV